MQQQNWGPANSKPAEQHKCNGERSGQQLLWRSCMFAEAGRAVCYPGAARAGTECGFPINGDLLLELMLLSCCCCSGIYLEFTGWVKWPLIFQQHTESVCSSAAAEVVPRQAQEPAGRIWGDFSVPTGESRFLPAWKCWGANFGLASSVSPRRNRAQTQTWVSSLLPGKGFCVWMELLGGTTHLEKKPYRIKT